MIFHDSHEALALRKMIDNKKKFLVSIKSEFSFQQIQKEILFLENEVLPIVLSSTNIIHSEFCNYAILSLDTALKCRCNGLLMYQPIEENYTDRPIIGVVNKRANQTFGTFGAMDIFIDNMDGMGAKVQPLNLIINDLM
jgi:hypothetical protein